MGFLLCPNNLSHFAFYNSERALRKCNHLAGKVTIEGVDQSVVTEQLDVHVLFFFYLN
ncbi:hypothetical protein JOC33_003443 [Thalassobacillus pellis]|nr:hypothetical protein [Thalassobacillus pellis]